MVNTSMLNAVDAFNRSMNNQYNVLNETLRQSQAATKEQYLSSTKSCDGKDPKEFSVWIDELKRLAIVTNKSHQEVAIATSRGILHKHIMELHNQHMDWHTIKTQLLERFSECGSSTMAKHKLAQLRQNDLPMPEYIAKFSDMTEMLIT